MHLAKCISAIFSSILCGVAWSLVLVAKSHAETPIIIVHPDESTQSLIPFRTGVCIEDVNHEIYGGLYSQMVFGESFQEPAPMAGIPGLSRVRWKMDGE